jgi:uncharacterized repeat protein (TIGR03803 family)
MRSRPSFLFWAILALIFSIATTPTAVAASKFKVLYNFTGGADGGQPLGLVEDAAGNLYGITGVGGDPSCAGGCGTVFKLDKAGKLTVLHKFTNGTDGEYPYATLALSGNMLYGAASQGGMHDCYYDYGCGVLFAINIQTHALKVLHTFNGSDGLYPSGGLLVRSGILYGTTLMGGSSENCGSYGCGVVYKLVLKTGTYTVLHSFDSSDGASPESALTLDNAGKVLYGTTAEGGSLNCYQGCGVVFRLTLRTSAYEALYYFNGSPDANYPYGPLALDASGNLYGDSQLGGSHPCLSEKGCGTVFVVRPKTGTDTVLHNFTGGKGGNYPLAGLIRSHAGTLYGTTAWGGSNDLGTVFELAKKTETVLHPFQGSDGSGPSAVVIIDSKGDLFGTTFAGGSHPSACAGYGCGVVWEFTP